MRALITSGGGAKGAFSVGALKVLHQQNLASFDIISGTSTGSLIAALAAAGMIDELVQEYKTVNNEDILAQTNLIESLTNNKPYFYDTLPLERKIDQYITDAVYHEIKGSGKYVCFTAINLQTGRRTVFTTRMFPIQEDYQLVEITSVEMFKASLLASTNQAAFLPPVKITVDHKEYQFVDGGNRDVLPVIPAINLNATEIFAISNNPLTLNQVTNEYTDLMKVLLRAISIFIQDVRENDYAVLDQYVGGQVFKIHPEMELDANNPTGLNFNRNDMLLWMRYGELAATRLLQDNNLISQPI